MSQGRLGHGPFARLNTATKKTVRSGHEQPSGNVRAMSASLYALRLLFLAQLRGRRGTAPSGVAARHEELLLPRWRAHAEKAYRLVRFVLERVRRVCGDING